jgi:hypothetical protein
MVGGPVAAVPDGLEDTTQVTHVGLSNGGQLAGAELSDGQIQADNSDTLLTQDASLMSRPQPMSATRLLGGGGETSALT